MAKSRLEGDGRPLARSSLSGVLKDEIGTNTSLSPVYGWSRKGERAHCSAPRNRGKNTTVLVSMSLEGMGSSLAVEGATTCLESSRDVRGASSLASTLRQGQVVVMANLTAACVSSVP